MVMGAGTGQLTGCECEDGENNQVDETFPSYTEEDKEGDELDHNDDDRDPPVLLQVRLKLLLEEKHHTALDSDNEQLDEDNEHHSADQGVLPHILDTLWLVPPHTVSQSTTPIRGNIKKVLIFHENLRIPLSSFTHQAMLMPLGQVDGTLIGHLMGDLRVVETYPTESVPRKFCGSFPTCLQMESAVKSYSRPTLIFWGIFVGWLMAQVRGHDIYVSNKVNKLRWLGASTLFVTGSWDEVPVAQWKWVGGISCWRHLGADERKRETTRGLKATAFACGMWTLMANLHWTL